MFAVKPLVLMILLQEDMYESALSICTKNVPVAIHNDILMTSESRKTGFHRFLMKIGSNITVIYGITTVETGLPYYITASWAW